MPKLPKRPILFAALGLSLLLCVAAIIPAQGKVENWPKTLDAAVIEIVSLLSDEGKKTVRETRKRDLIRFHHGWGTGIRNEFGLWRGNRELLESACGGKPCHPDNASMIIIESVWKALQKEAHEITLAKIQNGGALEKGDVILLDRERNGYIAVLEIFEGISSMGKYYLIDISLADESDYVIGSSIRYRHRYIEPVDGSYYITYICVYGDYPESYNISSYLLYAIPENDTYKLDLESLGSVSYINHSPILGLDPIGAWKFEGYSTGNSLAAQVFNYYLEQQKQ